MAQSIASFVLLGVCAINPQYSDSFPLFRKLREHGVDMVLVTDGSRLSAWDRQLAELSGAADEEAAD